MGEIRKVSHMEKVLEAGSEKKKEEKGKERGKISRRLLIGAMATLLAVEPLISSCAGVTAQNPGPKNPASVTERDCRKRSPIQENDTKDREDESTVSEKRLQEIVGQLRNTITYIPFARLWVNPDCGLKTRTETQVAQALGNMVAAAHKVREEIADIC